MDKEPDIVDRLIAAQLPICFEAAQLITWIRQERDEAMALIENIANEVNVLSTRPAAIIKFSDLVDQINEWGDAARKILGSIERLRVELVSITNRLDAKP